MSAPRSSVRLLGALSACLASGYGVLFTVVGDFRDEYGVGEADVGLLIGVGFFAAFAAQVFIAPVADRGRARQVVFAGVLLNVAGLLLMAFGGSWLPVLAGRIVSGVGIGAAIPAVRRIVVLSDPVNLGRNLGLLLSADVFGFALGPALSAVLVGPVGLWAPFVVVAALTLVLAAAAARVEVPETAALAGDHRFAFDLLRLRPVAGAVALGAGAFVVIGTFDALWDVVHEDLGTPTWMANLGVTLFAVPLMLLGPAGGVLAQRVGAHLVATLGLAIGAAFMAAYGIVPDGNWIFGLAMVHAVVDGLTFPAAGVAVSLAVPDDRQAAAQGVMGAAQALVGGTTAIAVGVTYDAWGRASAYAVGAGAVVVLALVGFALAGPVARRRRVAPVRAVPAA